MTLYTQHVIFIKHCGGHMTDNEHETFLRFGKKFQENMCQLMLEDRPFYDQISEVLDINFFEKKYSF